MYTINVVCPSCLVRFHYDRETLQNLDLQEDWGMVDGQLVCDTCVSDAIDALATSKEVIELEHRIASLERITSAYTHMHEGKKVVKVLIQHAGERNPTP